MTALAGIVLSQHDAAPGPARDAARRMLAAMAARGSDRVELWVEDGVALGVARAAWELAPGIADGVLLAVEHDVAVAADASLYYRDDLARALRAAGVEARGTAPAQLIAAAWRAWGERCLDHLEGDYAFVLWDRRRRLLFGARDFIGMRTLCYGRFGGELAIASTPGGVAAHPACSGEIDLAALGRAVANFYGDDQDTVFAGVRSLPAAHSLAFERGAGEPTIERFWTPPAFAGDEQPALAFEEAAEELRRLLMAATAERMSREGPTALTLSGGWDSPMIFACGQQWLKEHGLPAGRLHPVSLSYPVGDTGREDEMIADIAHFWGTEPTWIDSRELDMFDRVVERAGRRDEPFAHLYEVVNRALARGGHDAGARVLLNGFGGDTLFHQDPAYVADLLWRGNVVHFAREWRANRLPYEAGAFFQFALRPRLGRRALSLARRIKGAPLVEDLQREAPRWMRADFVRRHGLREREARATPERRGEAGAYEKRWMLEYQYFPRLHSGVFDNSFDEGVEIRCPFNDVRLLAFAASRPRTERRSRGETKRLPRAAVRGLLPEHVLAPRLKRTGTPTSYFMRWYRDRFPHFAIAAFTDPLLAELGIVDTRVLQRETNRLVNEGAQDEQLALYFTFQAELWLRARRGRQIAAEPRTDLVREITVPAAAGH